MAFCYFKVVYGDVTNVVLNEFREFIELQGRYSNGEEFHTLSGSRSVQHEY